MRSYTGHCYGYFAPIEAELKQRGIEVHLAGNRRQAPDFHRETEALEAFTFCNDERNVGQPRRLFGLFCGANPDVIRAAHETALVNDLLELHQRFAFRHDDLIIINTLGHWALRGIPLFAARLDPRELPRFSVISLFSSEPKPGVFNESRRHYGEAFQAICDSPARDRIRVFSDADTLIEEYSRLSPLPVSLAPFPQDHGRPAANASGGPLIVSYVGEARDHKGFHLLPFLVGHVGCKYSAAQVCFHIQTYISDPRQRFYKRSMSALRKAENVTLIPGILSDLEYSELLSRSNVILLPYKTTFYHRQTSAVYNSAASMGIPVVVSRGTWMSRKVQQLGGGALCNPDDAHSLGEAVIDVCARYNEYAKAASDAGSRWRAFNNTKSFIRVMDWSPD
ncbi:MAG: glycosyltransferase [Beijerinckiaceae bacterium]